MSEINPSPLPPPGHEPAYTPPAPAPAAYAAPQGYPPAAAPQGFKTGSDSNLGVHLPLTLLGLSFCIYLAAQIAGASQTSKTMDWQLSNVKKQIENVKSGEKQNDEIAKKMEEPLKQAAQLESGFSALLNDVVDLAKDDENAKKVVQKWGIKRNNPPAGSDSDKK